MLTWVGIARLGAVQLALGAIVVLMTSTLNRLMVVELALPAILPGLLVGWHYAVQLSRPLWGHRSDSGGGRTPWIVGGMLALAAGGLLAAAAVPVMEQRFVPGFALAVLAYALVGFGAGAAGTSVLALLAAACPPRRRAAAATITWLMMIFGIALTASLAGPFLDPYSHGRMLAVVAAVCAAAVALSLAALWRLERGTPRAPGERAVPFAAALAETWADPRARSFTIFVFLSMIAYFMQELILEPYAGLAFAMTPGETTALSGLQHQGVFLGMLAVGIAATGLRIGSLRVWVTGGCLGSAAALLVIAALGQTAGAGLPAAVMALGICNGVFAVAAIGAMMALAGEGGGQRTGTRMGLWGAAQAIAAGAGGLSGAALADALRLVLPDRAAFGTVFAAEAALFAAAAVMAARILDRGARAGALLAGE
jgi:BCD family chlorophyll transporter-like MFS transporter